MPVSKQYKTDGVLEKTRGLLPELRYLIWKDMSDSFQDAKGKDETAIDICNRILPSEEFIMAFSKPWRMEINHYLLAKILELNVAAVDEVNPYGRCVESHSYQQWTGFPYLDEILPRIRKIHFQIEICLQLISPEFQTAEDVHHTLEVAPRLPSLQAATDLMDRCPLLEHVCIDITIKQPPITLDTRNCTQMPFPYALRWISNDCGLLLCKYECIKGICIRTIEEKYAPVSDSSADPPIDFGRESPYVRLARPPSYMPTNPAPHAYEDIKRGLNELPSQVVISKEWVQSRIGKLGAGRPAYRHLSCSCSKLCTRVRASASREDWKPCKEWGYSLKAGTMHGRCWEDWSDLVLKNDTYPS
ncbi:hypothetical protein BT63DRAFT_115642 [Microthyrium microscopicum]|uniref:Uncharacterized protein n=1 Tax=Microthyrium microscopicum TaxID=703497 RepID=A0A6A6TW18_9PEZI|nr:hypothetical protein BT63DRAFT_115642 [Microthyrium microscopicum]